MPHWKHAVGMGQGLLTVSVPPCSWRSLVELISLCQDQLCTIQMNLLPCFCLRELCYLMKTPCSDCKLFANIHLQTDFCAVTTILYSLVYCVHRDTCFQTCTVPWSEFQIFSFLFMWFPHGFLKTVVPMLHWSRWKLVYMLIHSHGEH